MLQQSQHKVSLTNDGQGNITKTTQQQTRSKIVISDSRDLTNPGQVDNVKGLVQNCHSLSSFQETETSPVFMLGNDSHAIDTIEEEIPEDLPAADSPGFEIVKQETFEPQMSKKKQAKADKKKEAKQNAKLKVQQKKQQEAELQAQKEQKKKEIREKKQQQQNQQIEEENKNTVEEDKIQMEIREQQMHTRQNVDVQLPGLVALNEHDGRLSTHSRHDSVIRTQKQSKTVKFPFNPSNDGSNSAHIPKRGSSRGNSMTSQKEDGLINQLDDLFAPEYTKAQPATVESLNNSKKNTPENTSNKIQDPQKLNDKLLNKKLEQLNFQRNKQFETDDNHRGTGARSSSVPLVDKKEKKSKSKNRKEENKDAEIPQIAQIPPVKTKKEKTNKDKTKLTTNDDHIEPQAPVQIMRPEKLTKQQLKKQKKEEAKKLALGDKSAKATDVAKEGKTKTQKQKQNDITRAQDEQKQQKKGKGKPEEEKKVSEPVVSQQQLQEMLLMDNDNQQYGQHVQDQISIPQNNSMGQIQQVINQTLQQQQQYYQNQDQPSTQQQFPNQTHLTVNVNYTHVQQNIQQPQAQSQNQRNQVSPQLIAQQNKNQPNSSVPLQNANSQQWPTSQQQQQFMMAQQQNFGQQQPFYNNNQYNNFNAQMMQRNLQNMGMNMGYPNMQQQQNQQQMPNQIPQQMNPFAQNQNFNPAQASQQQQQYQNMIGNYMQFQTMLQQQQQQQSALQGKKPNQSMQQMQMTMPQNANAGNTNQQQQPFGGNLQNHQLLFQQQMQNNILKMQQSQSPPTNVGTPPNMGIVPNQMMPQIPQQMFKNLEQPASLQQQQSQTQINPSLPVAQQNNSTPITDYKTVMIADQLGNKHDNNSANSQKQRIQDGTLNESSNAFIPSNRHQTSPQYSNLPSLDANDQNQGLQNNQQFFNQHFMQNINPEVNQQKKQKLCELYEKGYILDTNEEAQIKNWSLAKLGYVEDFYQFLDAQIIAVQHDQVYKLQKAQKLREIAFDLIKKKIQNVYGKKNQKSDGARIARTNPVKVEMYGSMATGLAIDSSDLDILVHDFIDQNSPRFRQLTREELEDEMKMLHSELSTIYAVKDSNFINSATVPVIKLKMDLVEICSQEKQKNKKFEIQSSDLDDETKILHIDITLDEPKKSGDQEHLGLQTCKYIKEKIKEYPHLKILALIFKKFLSLINMNIPYTGGLSSYSLIQMIIAVLNELKYSKQNESISTIFKNFIFRYAFLFDPSEQGISEDCHYLDKSKFDYLNHKPECNINSPQITQLDEQINYQLPANQCTCGSSTFNFNSDQAQQNQGSTEEDTIRHLLMGFVNTNSGSKQQIGSSTLIIVDPLNRYNNIGKSSFNFEEIKIKFKSVYGRLTQEMIKFVDQMDKKNNGEFIAIQQNNELDQLIPRILNINYTLTQQISPSHAIVTPEKKLSSQKKHSPQEEEKKRPSSDKKSDQNLQLQQQASSSQSSGSKINTQQKKTKGKKKNVN